MAVTIKDIATRAGVSRGTVDRVIHNRGNVAPFLKQRIENVITELGYKRNIIASQLVRNKTVKIATILPHPAEDVYWSLPQLGIQEAVEEYKHFSVQIESHFFNLAQAQSFEKAVGNISWAEIDAFIIAPIYQTESLEFIERCKLQKKAIICINTNISTEETHTTYVGQDSYQSGVLAGKLFDLSIPDSSEILIIRIGKYVEDPQHYFQKERGIRDYFNHHAKTITFRNIQLLDYSNVEYMQKDLAKQLQRSNTRHYIFIPNSKAYRLIQILDKETLAKCHLIGFDLISENIHELQNGNIDFIINQNPKRQGYLAIKLLINRIILDIDIPKIMYVPLDIIVKENINVGL